MNQEDLKVIDNHISKLTNNKVAAPCRLRYIPTGEFITLSSNKTVWLKPGHAKAALKLEYPSLFRYSSAGYIHVVTKEIVTFAEKNKREKEAIEYFFNNYIEIVSL